MGKRTSDFVALAAILGGAGLGFGLTSLFAGAAPMAEVDDVSVEVQVMQRRAIVGDRSDGPTIYFRRLDRETRPDWGRSLRRGDVEELRREITETDLKKLLEALDEVEALKDLDLGQYLSIDILQRDEDEDQRRRRRRRRRPHQEAEVPDASRNK
jgi:hypothetical protein